MISRGLVPFALGVSLVACESEAPPTMVALLDSAGVPVASNPPPSQATPTFEISADPRMTIGDPARGPEHELFRVSGGTVFDDGVVVLANSGTYELRYYDETGAHLGSVGGQGEGPGEFLSLSLLGPFAGDSLMAWDLRQRRLSVFAPDRSVARTLQLPAGLGGAGTTPVGVLSNGGVVLVVNEIAVADSMATTGIERRPARIVVLDPSGGIGGELGPFPGPETSVVIREVGSSVFGVVFGRGVHAGARGDRIAVANDDAYSIRTYGPDGALLRIARQVRDPVRVQPGDFERGLPEVLRPDSPPSPAKEQFAANIEQMPRHETFPAFGASPPRDLRFDRTGTLWVPEYQPPWDEQASWQAFDRDGVLVGRLDLPERASWLDIGPDWILVRARDELDVETVSLYELRRPPNPARPATDAR